MRVLIYIESFPIREGKGIFDGVARKFFPLLKSSSVDFDVRMYAPKVVVDSFSAQEIASIGKRIIKTTPEEDRFFQENLGRWRDDGVTRWLDLMDGGAWALPYVQMLERIWAIFPFDVIIHWGENGAVSNFVSGKEITRVGMELGCTRSPFKDSLVADPYGTNGNAILPKLSIEDVSQAVGGRSMSAAEALLMHSESMDASPYEQQFQVLPSSAETSALLSSTKPIALLALQLHDDANLLHFSNYDSVEMLVTDVVPKLIDAGYKVAVKTHPAAKVRTDSQAAFSIAQGALGHYQDDVIWLDSSRLKIESAQLFSLVDLVVTVNSSLGFEALYFDKLVCVLGDAVYQPSGVFPTLSQVLEGDFDLGKYLHQVGFLREFVLNGYLHDSAILKQPMIFEHLIRTLDFGFKQFGGEPRELAKFIYRAIGPARIQLAESRVQRGGSLPGANDFGKARVIERKAQASEVTKRTTDFENDFKSAIYSLMTSMESSNPDLVRFAIESARNDVVELEELIRASKLVDTEFYAGYKDVVRAGLDPVHHWVRFGAEEGRQCRRGLRVEGREGLLRRLLKAVDSIQTEPLLPTFALDSQEELQRRRSLAEIRRQLESSSCKVAVVAHLYYTNLVPEMISFLRNIPEEFELVVTMPSWGNDEIRRMVKEFHSNSVFYPVPNRGRDIAPFLDVLNILVQLDFQEVLHVHTKAGYFFQNGFYRDMGAAWRYESLQSLLGNSERVAGILSTMRENPEVNMVGPSSFFLGVEKFPYSDGGEFARLVAGDSQPRGFFGGTMFWAKPKVFADLFSRTNISLLSFSPETGDNDGQLAHIIERLFGHMASVGDGKIVGVNSGLIDDHEIEFEFDLEPKQNPLEERLNRISTILRSQTSTGLDIGEIPSK